MQGFHLVRRCPPRPDTRPPLARGRFRRIQFSKILVALTGENPSLLLLSLKRACPLMVSLVRARSLSKHAHFVVVNRWSGRLGRGWSGKSSRNFGIFVWKKEGLCVATCEISFFLSFFIFLEFSTISARAVGSRGLWWMAMEGEFVSFATTGFRFRKGFKGRGGLAEKLKRLFFGTPRPKLQLREQRFSTVLGKFSSSPRYYAAPREGVV